MLSLFPVKEAEAGDVATEGEAGLGGEFVPVPKGGMRWIPSCFGNPLISLPSPTSLGPPSQFSQLSPISPIQGLRCPWHAHPCVSCIESEKDQCQIGGPPGDKAPSLPFA